jgi:uncharacterized protein (DUF1501 family)
MKTINRRTFLKASAATAAAATPIFAGGLSPKEDYKALVCILLEGGADTIDMVVPKIHASAYDAYRQVRPGTAQENKKLRPLVGSRYGLHPEMPHLQRLYHQRNLAIVANVGALEHPTDKKAILKGSATLPPQLFQKLAQRDHQMMGGDTDSGWAARVADRIGSPLANVSFGGQNRMQEGGRYAPLIGYDEHFGVLNDPHNLIGRLKRIDMGVPHKQLDVGMPLSEQLEYVASLMAARHSAGLPDRQIYFVRQSGWDTHGLQADEIVRKNRRNTAELDTAIGAFVATLDRLGLSENVTTFTTQDLASGMALTPTGADHGWGGHSFVIGAAVRGGIHGTLPRLAPDSPDALDGSAVIPTIATDQYLATLVDWLGDGKMDVNAIFPRLPRFERGTLGFMA